MKAKMKTLALLILLLIPTIFSAQTITGKVIDEKGVIPFANVTITGENYEIITGASTDENGLFLVKVDSGTYKISISFIG